MMNVTSPDGTESRSSVSEKSLFWVTLTTVEAEPIGPAGSSSGVAGISVGSGGESLGADGC